MIDKFGEPILIDFGGTTQVKNPKSLTASLRYVPPEVLSKPEYELLRKAVEAENGLEAKTTDLDRMLENDFPLMMVLNEMFSDDPQSRLVTDKATLQIEPSKYQDCSSFLDLLLNDAFYHDFLNLTEPFKNLVMTDPMHKKNFEEALEGLKKWREDNKVPLREKQKIVDDYWQKNIELGQFVPKKNDRFANGFILEEIFMGCKPGAIPDDQYREKYQRIPKEVRDVIEGLKHPDPKKRLTDAEAEAKMVSYLSKPNP